MKEYLYGVLVFTLMLVGIVLVGAVIGPWVCC